MNKSLLECFVLQYSVIFVLPPPSPPPSPNSYVFPRLLLSHHFWTEQQRHEFWQRDLRHRLQHFYPILDHMHLLSQYIHDQDMETRIVKIVKKVCISIYVDISNAFIS